MDDVVEQFRELYKKFGIIYENPVRNWPTPPDQQFIDKVIVNNHGGDFLLGDGVIQTRKTTGHYLFSIGLLPNVNVKGSSLDFKMQHDCYPFALYNILAFWGFLSFEPYEIYCHKMANLMADKISCATKLIAEYKRKKENSPLSVLIGPYPKKIQA